MKDRHRILDREPLCRDCKDKGIVTAATEVDHIVPLEHGGLDTDDNKRPLCHPCHVIRTAEQFGHAKRQAIGDDGWPVE